MPQVMKSRLKTSSIVALHASSETQSIEGSLCGSPFYRTSRTRNEERSIRSSRILLLALGGILGQYVDEIRAERHEPCLVELAFTNLDNSSQEIYLAQGQGERLADAQTGTVQQEDKRAERVGLNLPARVATQSGCFEQTT